eukprot:120390-Amphidinium_carterae.1
MDVKVIVASGFAGITHATDAHCLGWLVTSDQMCCPSSGYQKTVMARAAERQLDASCASFPVPLDDSVSRTQTWLAQTRRRWRGWVYVSGGALPLIMCQLGLAHFFRDFDPLRKGYCTPGQVSPHLRTKGVTALSVTCNTAYFVCYSEMSTSVCDAS